MKLRNMVLRRSGTMSRFDLEKELTCLSEERSRHFLCQSWSGGSENSQTFLHRFIVDPANCPSHFNSAAFDCGAMPG